MGWDFLVRHGRHCDMYAGRYSKFGAIAVATVTQTLCRSDVRLSLLLAPQTVVVCGVRGVCGCLASWEKKSEALEAAQLTPRQQASSSPPILPNILRLRLLAS